MLNALINLGLSENLINLAQIDGRKLDKFVFNKSGYECLTALVKDVQYFYAVLEQKSLDFINTADRIKGELKGKLNLLDETLMNLEKVKQNCLNVKVKDKNCLKDCIKLSNEFAAKTLDVFRVVEIIDRIPNSKGKDLERFLGL